LLRSAGQCFSAELPSFFTDQRQVALPVSGGGLQRRDPRLSPLGQAGRGNKDHRAIKRRINASQHFRSFWGAWRTIAGYEAIHMIRKGQAYGSAAGAKVGLLHRFIVSMFGIEA
jgi:hypothetical protein